MAKLSPSILGCDYLELGNACKQLEECGTDMLHLDVYRKHGEEREHACDGIDASVSLYIITHAYLLLSSLDSSSLMSYGKSPLLIKHLLTASRTERANAIPTPNPVPA